MMDKENISSLNLPVTMPTDHTTVPSYCDESGGARPKEVKYQPHKRSKHDARTKAQQVADRLRRKYCGHGHQHHHCEEEWCNPHGNQHDRERSTRNSDKTVNRKHRGSRDISLCQKMFAENQPENISSHAKASVGNDPHCILRKMRRCLKKRGETSTNNDADTSKQHSKRLQPNIGALERPEHNCLAGCSSALGCHGNTCVCSNTGTNLQSDFIITCLEGGCFGVYPAFKDCDLIFDGERLSHSFLHILCNCDELMCDFRRRFLLYTPTNLIQTVSLLWSHWYQFLDNCICLKGDWRNLDWEQSLWRHREGPGIKSVQVNVPDASRENSLLRNMSDMAFPDATREQSLVTHEGLKEKESSITSRMQSLATHEGLTDSKETPDITREKTLEQNLLGISVKSTSLPTTPERPLKIAFICSKENLAKGNFGNYSISLSSNGSRKMFIAGQIHELKLDRQSLEILQHSTVRTRHSKPCETKRDLKQENSESTIDPTSSTCKPEPCKIKQMSTDLIDIPDPLQCSNILNNSNNTNSTPCTSETCLADSSSMAETSDTQVRVNAAGSTGEVTGLELPPLNQRRCRCLPRKTTDRSVKKHTFSHGNRTSEPNWLPSCACEDVSTDLSPCIAQDGNVTRSSAFHDSSPKKKKSRSNSGVSANLRTSDSEISDVISDPKNPSADVISDPKNPGADAGLSVGPRPKRKRLSFKDHGLAMAVEGPKPMSCDYNVENYSDVIGGPDMPALLSDSDPELLEYLSLSYPPEYFWCSRAENASVASDLIVDEKDDDDTLPELLSDSGDNDEWYTLSEEDNSDFACPMLIVPESEEESGDADDEFECDCSHCANFQGRVHESLRLEADEALEYGVDGNRGDSTEEGLEGAEWEHHVGIEQINFILTSGNRLLGMFQSVVMQMLILHPELLSDGAPPPASDRVITSLPQVTMGQSHVDQELACPICLSRCELGEHLSELPCHHLFHQPCIGAWLIKSGTCPVCRHML